MKESDKPLSKQELLAAAHRELQRYDEENAGTPRRRFRLRLKPSGVAEAIALVCACAFLVAVCILAYTHLFVHR